jgi:hypothetical protein
MDPNMMVAQMPQADQLTWTMFLQHRSDSLARANDSLNQIMRIVLAKDQLLMSEHRFLQSHHAIGIFLGFIALVALGTYLTVKGRKLRRHYHDVLDYNWELTTSYKKDQETLKDLDPEYEPTPLLDESQKSQWPRFYTRIVWGGIVGFFLVYFFFAF